MTPIEFQSHLKTELIYETLFLAEETNDQIFQTHNFLRQIQIPEQEATHHRSHWISLNHLMGFQEVEWPLF